MIEPGLIQPFIQKIMNPYSNMEGEVDFFSRAPSPLGEIGIQNQVNIFTLSVNSRYLFVNLLNSVYNYERS